MPSRSLIETRRPLDPEASRRLGLPLLGHAASNAETDVVRLEQRCALVMGHRSAMEGDRAPGTAPYARFAALAGARVDAPILAPFPDIAQHVVQAKGIRL